MKLNGELKKKNNMKRILYLSTVIICLGCACLWLTACGDDDVDIDRDYTNVSYKVEPTYDLQKFYKIIAYYTDFDGKAHEEVIEDSNEWNYRERKSGDHSIRCRVVALAKTAEEYGDLDVAYYDLGYSYSIHWYKQEGGAHSIQPVPWSESVSKNEVPAYLANHPTITIFEFNK